jgi:dihydrofolate reductase
MGTLITDFSMSLDGYIAGPDEDFSKLFAWYAAGDTEYTWPGNGMRTQVTKASAEHLEEMIARTGALVAGRRLFDITNGWDGRHPVGVPVFVVSHRPRPEGWVGEGSPYPCTFVDGLESAIEQAREAAGDKDVVVASANIAQQCLRAGILDEVHLDLVPYVLNGGVRLFDGLGPGAIDLERTGIVATPHVTHIAFRVVR